MARIEYTALLRGDAASFKGGRDYVHATDLIPALEAVAAELPEAPVLTSVEFHAALRTRAVLHVETAMEPPLRTATTATGTFKGDDGTAHPFLVFPSPLPISSTARPFDEESLWARCQIDAEARFVRAAPTAALSVPEHISSMMKLLCRTQLPQYGHWWFVRLTKAKPLPDRVTQLTIAVRRVIAERMVSADITTEAGRLGQIDFVGSNR